MRWPSLATQLIPGGQVACLDAPVWTRPPSTRLPRASPSFQSSSPLYATAVAAEVRDAPRTPTRFGSMHTLRSQTPHFSTRGGTGARAAAMMARWRCGARPARGSYRIAYCALGEHRAGETRSLNKGIVNLSIFASSLEAGARSRRMRGVRVTHCMCVARQGQCILTQMCGLHHHFQSTSSIKMDRPLPARGDDGAMRP
ncbi:hypothetical protein B0H11DRAFT_1031970 [Mycena galericulata]|nr:hypothetical protein B0H11DRAFT_1031970 [Mycena galericulata]